jgi:hypothetical protein
MGISGGCTLRRCSCRSGGQSTFGFTSFHSPGSSSPAQARMARICATHRPHSRQSLIVCLVWRPLKAAASAMAASGPPGGRGRHRGGHTSTLLKMRLERIGDFEVLSEDSEKGCKLAATEHPGWTTSIPSRHRHRLHRRLKSYVAVAAISLSRPSEMRAPRQP